MINVFNNNEEFKQLDFFSAITQLDMDLHLMQNNPKDYWSRHLRNRREANIVTYYSRYRYY